ncbi:MAG: CheR family methyltransferase [Gammaproteobacteria bacterium]
MAKQTAETGGETYFFRDHGQFDLLRLRLLPELIERRQKQKMLRLWSAGCASGEEAYSLAILIDMLLPKRDDWEITIIASDINSAALEKAKTARYGPWSFRMVPTDIRNRYFKPINGEWILHDDIRGMVDFSHDDLINKAFPTGKLQKMDLILCRNVFIYFDNDAVIGVAKKFVAALNENGYLMTAHAELLGLKLPAVQSRLFPEGVIYQRVSAPPVDMPALVRTPVPQELKFNRPMHRVASPKTRTHPLPVSITAPFETNLENGLATAWNNADRGDYDRAEECCNRLLKSFPLAVEPHFLLAELSQLKHDFVTAETLLCKALYLDPDCVAAALELAALYERNDNPTKASRLRAVALDMLLRLPGDSVIEPYKTSASEIANWLAQSTESKAR